MIPRISTNILFTLAYTDQFDFPLTEDEVVSRLIVLDKGPISKTDVKKQLQKLLQEKRIVQQDGYYFLPGRAALVQKRQDRQKISEKKWLEIQFLKKCVKFMPSVLIFFITGSLAMNNTDEDDDIDLLIVTKRNRLWLTRLELIALSIILGKKKKRFDEGKHGWCFNLWLDEDHLAVSETKRDLYQAYEVVQAKPLFVRDQTIVSFYEENAWLKSFLPFVKISQFETFPIRKENHSLFSPFLDALEDLAYQVQLNYMKSHQTTEKVGKGYAFFHPRPTTTLVKDGWLSSIQHLKNVPELGTIAKQYAARLFTPTTPTPSRSR